MCHAAGMAQFFALYEGEQGSVALSWLPHRKSGRLFAISKVGKFMHGASEGLYP